MAEILIVDDRPVNREFLRSLLSYGGHSLIEAADGDEGYTLAQAACPDLIITDLAMPNVNGFEFAKKVRANPKLLSTPVIFYTATYRVKDAKQLADEVGAVRVLSKPADPETILNVVNDILFKGPHRTTADFPPIQPYVPVYKEVEENLKQHLTKTQMLSQQMAYIIDIGVELAEERNPLQLLQIGCEAACKMIHSEYGVLGLLDSKRENLQHHISTGTYSKTIDDDLANFYPWSGILQPVLAEQKIHYVNGLNGDPLEVGFPVGHPPIYSILAVPLSSSLKTYGWIYVANKEDANTYSESDGKLLRTLATQITLAYENLELYQSVQEHANQLHKEISERKKAQTALVLQADDLARSNQELAQFAYIASHDLQQPLRTVISYLQLLQYRYRDSLDNEADEFIEFAVSGALRMKTLIDDLLNYSQIREVRAEYPVVDLNDVMTTVLENINALVEEKGAVIDWVTLPSVNADSGQMEQLFQNLLANGIKFQKNRHPTIQVRVESVNEQWQFSVADNGIGIAQEHVQKIFKIFKRLHAQTEFPGTGIGLAICNKIVERHSGKIWVQSVPGDGSTFYFTLPVMRSKSTNGQST